ncbi:MAG: tetratricopeptide repeat protein, partial [Elusimicrobia bacterium]|nr:tetratricopeptide repeat protein [Elusimicrobiota bacterium]
VQTKLDKFIFARYDSETEVGWPLHQRFKVRNWPTFIFFDRYGTEIERLLGFKNAKDFTVYLDQTFQKIKRPTEDVPPDPLAALFQKLDIASKQGNEELSLKYYGELERLDPKNQKDYRARAMFLYAESKRGKMKYAEASKILEDLVQKFPESPLAEDAAYLLEGNYRKEGLEKALHFYKMMIQKYPQGAFWYDAYAYLCGLNRYRMAEGFEMAQKAIRLDHKNAGFHVTLAKLYHTKRDLANAVKSMKKAVQLDPKDESLREKLARYEGELSALKNLQEHKP